MLKVGLIMLSNSGKGIWNESNISTGNVYHFNPGTFVTALNNNYGFDSRGNLQYAAISKVVPNFKYQAHVNLRDKNKSKKLNEIKRYYESDYYEVTKHPISPIVELVLPILILDHSLPFCFHSVISPLEPYTP